MKRQIKKVVTTVLAVALAVGMAQMEKSFGRRAAIIKWLR